MSKLQKKAARVITGDSYDIRSNEVFQKLNWLPMNTQSFQNKPAAAGAPAGATRFTSFA